VTIFPNKAGFAHWCFGLAAAESGEVTPGPKPNIMKTERLVAMIAVAAFALTGCKKEESTVAPSESGTAASSQPALEKAVKETADQATAAASATADTVKQQVEAAKPAAQQAVQDATAAAQQAGSQAQKLIDQAKQYITSEKYQDALTTLQQLANLKLTPEQQKLVDGLKAQAQSLMAKKAGGDAASAVGNALGGKK
jgi:hypothetical protein